MNWEKLQSLFGKDDGSLPDIEMNNLSGDEVVRGYEFVRNHSGCISSKNPYYWSIPAKREVPIFYEDKPANLVVSCEAECFHLCFGKIKSPNGKQVPDLGLYVFQDSLSFDYRMGSEWDREAVEGLFSLMFEMAINFKEVSIEHKSNMNDIDGTIFKKSWEAYKSVQQI